MNGSTNPCAGCAGCGAERACAGCGAERPLTELERELLELFAETPWLPLLRERGQYRVPGLEASEEALRLGLQLLQRRGLIALEADTPLAGFDYSAWPAADHGSAALTARGREALDSLEYGG